MPKRNKKARLEMDINQDDMFQLEQEYHRLHQEVIRLKKANSIPKSKKFTVISVRRMVIKLGLREIGKLSYPEFERLCKSLNS